MLAGMLPNLTHKLTPKTNIESIYKDFVKRNEMDQFCLNECLGLGDEKQVIYTSAVQAWWVLNHLL